VLHFSANSFDNVSVSSFIFFFKEIYESKLNVCTNNSFSFTKLTARKTFFSERVEAEILVSWCPKKHKGKWDSHV
jgi:hypothetical protein